MDIWIVSGILLVSVGLLITERLPVDVTAIGIIAALSATGVLTPLEAVSGFANPAVITVAAMFLISSALVKTGAIAFLSDKVAAVSGPSKVRALILVFGLAAVSSAFINNTPVVVLFIPVLMGMCCRYGLSPSRLLIPLSYISILGGTCTLIGTSTNIIVSDLSAGLGHGRIGMFELAAVGLPIAVCGILLIVLTAGVLLPRMANPACEMEQRTPKTYLSRLMVRDGSVLAGTRLTRTLPDAFPGLDIIELVRGGHIFYPDRDRIVIAPGDLLLVKGPAPHLLALLEKDQAVLPHAEALSHQSAQEKAETLLVEVIIPPQSSFLGEAVRDVVLFQTPEIHIIAVQRKGLHYSEKNIDDIRLRVGDILLVQLPWKKLDQMRGFTDFIMVEDVQHRMQHRDKASAAGLVFLAVVCAAATGVLDIMTAAVSGAFLLFITRCISVREAYRALQGDILVLIAGTIALGVAMEKTGASGLYARWVLASLHGASPNLILGAFILLTSVGTQLLSNNATAVLVLPVAVSTALNLGVCPRPFIIAVCIGASACFATPIGYQTNLLVYGPGGYRFADYLKLGIPLNLLVLVFGTVLIPKFWPL